MRTGQRGIGDLLNQLSQSHPIKLEIIFELLVNGPGPHNPVSVEMLVETHVFCFNLRWGTWRDLTSQVKDVILPHVT